MNVLNMAISVSSGVDRQETVASLIGCLGVARFSRQAAASATWRASEGVGAGRVTAVDLDDKAERAVRACAGHIAGGPARRVCTTASKPWAQAGRRPGRCRGGEPSRVGGGQGRPFRARGVRSRRGCGRTKHARHMTPP